jgi:hypothetical protein
MKNSNDTIGNRTRDLPACSAVTQPVAPPRAPLQTVSTFKKKACGFLLADQRTGDKDGRSHDTDSNWGPWEQSALVSTNRVETRAGYVVLKLAV